MGLRLSRLRAGEIIAGASGIVLAAVMFVLPWFSVKSPAAGSIDVNGWHSLSHVRWLLVVTIIAAGALAYFQAARRAPAIPVTLSVIVTVLALLSVLALIYRVLINVPGSDALVSALAGAYLGLLAAVGILYGGFASMRKEGIAPQDGPSEIEIVRSSAAG